jgi:predicted nucleotidyltransferase
MYLSAPVWDDWRPDSDYDVLIVLNKKDQSVKDRLYDAVMEVLLSEDSSSHSRFFGIRVRPT